MSRILTSLKNSLNILPLILTNPKRIDNIADGVISYSVSTILLFIGVILYHFNILNIDTSIFLFLLSIIFLMWALGVKEKNDSDNNSINRKISRIVLTIIWIFIIFIIIGIYIMLFINPSTSKPAIFLCLIDTIFFFVVIFIIGKYNKPVNQSQSPKAVPYSSKIKKRYLVKNRIEIDPDFSKAQKEYLAKMLKEDRLKTLLIILFFNFILFLFFFVL